MADTVLVWTTSARAGMARAVLAAGCAATGVQARLEVFTSSGSLFRRLANPREGGRAELVFGTGPYMAESGVAEGLLRRWAALDYAVFATLGQPPATAFDSLLTVGRLALPDPERSEVGMMAVLASLDRARQMEGDPERAWAWWQRRVVAGVSLPDTATRALDAVRAGRASHALVLGPILDLAPLSGLAPVPNAVGLAKEARNAAAGGVVFDWLTSPDAARAVASAGGLSPHQADTNGLRVLEQAAPPLDVTWATQQYRATRARWAASGFSPTPA